MLIRTTSDLTGPRPERWYDRLEREESELEAALDDACRTDPDPAVQPGQRDERWQAEAAPERHRVEGHDSERRPDPHQGKRESDAPKTFTRSNRFAAAENHA